VKQAEIAQARTRWLQRRSYGVLALMFAATLAAVWQVYGFWQRVTLNRSEFIASQALDHFNIGHDRVTAELLALEALPDEDSTSALQRLLPFEGTAQMALHDAYRNYTNETWAERRLLSGHTDLVRAVAFSPDGKLALTGSVDQTARLWETATGKPVATLSGHTGSVYAVAFSPDGKLALTGSWDNTARLWEAATGKPVATLSGHTGSVDAVAFSPDGKLALTGSVDKTARLWEAATGKPVATLSGHTDRVGAVAFSPDGKLALTGSWDNTARLWELLATQSLIREAKSSLTRCLTSDQRQRFHLVPAAPRWCISMNLWPYDDPAKTPMPPLTWDERFANAWDALAVWATARSR